MRIRAEDVREIRTANKMGVSQSDLAKKYGVRPDTISAIVRRKTWEDVK